MPSFTETIALSVANQDAERLAAMAETPGKYFDHREEYDRDLEPLLRKVGEALKALGCPYLIVVGTANTEDMHATAFSAHVDTENGVANPDLLLLSSLAQIVLDEKKASTPAGLLLRSIAYRNTQGQV